MSTASFRTFRVFISSSFKDMHGERDYLNATVFPHLDSWLADRGWRLQAMDLRGSTADASMASEEAVLRMCLSGVEYCRPYFLGLIGDRYGWIPQGPAAEDALSNISAELDLPYAELTGKSATHLEIYYALKLLPKEKCFFYTRKVENESELPEYEYIDNKMMQQALKKEINRIMRPAHSANLRSYTAYWHQGFFTRLESFGQKVFDDLKTAFEKDMEADGADDVSRPEQQAVFYFAQKEAGSVLMEEVDEVVAHAMRNDEKALLLITGCEGSGKSTLIAQTIRRLENENCLLLTYVGGMDPASSTLNDMITFFTSCLAQYLDAKGVEYDPEFEKEYRYGLFDHLLRTAAQSIQVILMVDGMEALGTSPDVREFLWIDVGLPKNIRFIISIPQNGFYTSHAHHLIELPAARTQQQLAEILKAAAAKRGKSFDVNILDLAAHKAAQNGTPLYAGLLADYLMSMTGADYHYSQSPHAHLEWMEEAISTTGITTREAFSNLINRAKQSLGMAVEYVLSFVALSRNGVREIDLLSAMSQYSQHSAMMHQLGDLEETPLPDSAALLALRGLLREHLNPFAQSGYWRFEHAVMRQCMLEKLEEVSLGVWHDSDRSYSAFLHSIMAETLHPLPNTDLFKRHEYLWHCYYADRPKDALDILYQENHNADMRYEVLGTTLHAILLEDEQRAISFFSSMLEASMANGRYPKDYALLYHFVCNELLELSISGAVSSQVCTSLLCTVIQMLEYWGVAECSYGLEVSFYMQALRTLLRVDVLLNQKDAVSTHSHTASKLVLLAERLLQENTREDVRHTLYANLSIAYRFLATDEKNASDMGQTTQDCYEKARSYAEQAKNGKMDVSYYADLVDIVCIYANYLEDRDYLTAIHYFEEAVKLGDDGLQAYLFSVGEEGFFYLDLYEQWKRLSFAKTRLATLYSQTGLFEAAQELYQNVISFCMRISENLTPDYTRALEFAQWLNDSVMMLVTSEEYNAALPGARWAADQFLRLQRVDGNNQLLQRWYWQLLRVQAMCAQMTGSDWKELLDEAVQAGAALGFAEEPEVALYGTFSGMADAIAEKSIYWEKMGNYEGALTAAGVELDLRCRMRNWGGKDNCDRTLDRLVSALPSYVQAAEALSAIYQPSDHAGELVRLCYALLCLGKTVLYAGDPMAAKTIFEKLETYTGELCTHEDSYAVRPGQTVCYELGEYCRKNGMLREAIVFYEQANHFATMMENRPLDLTMMNLYCLCSLRLADIFSLFGDFESAQMVYEGVQEGLETLLDGRRGIPGPEQVLAYVKDVLQR